MTIGERVNALRRERKMTIDALAEKAYISKHTLVRWIYTKDAHPDIVLLAYVADALGVSLDYLAGRTEIREMAQQGEAKKPVVCSWCGQLNR